MSHSTDQVNFTEIRTDGEIGIPQRELTITEEALLLYLHTYAKADKATKEGVAEMQGRREKIKFMHDLQAEINRATNAEGKLNLKDNPELRAKLEQAKEFGLIFKDKESFDSNETSHLLSAVINLVDDLDADNTKQTQEITNLYRMTEQLINMASNMESSTKKTLGEIIRNFR